MLLGLLMCCFFQTEDQSDLKLESIPVLAVWCVVRAFDWRRM